MSLNDPLANVLSHLNNEDVRGKSVVVTDSNSKFIRNVLNILHDKGYIGEIEVVDDSKGGHITINLLNRINKCGVIKPRFSVQVEEYEKFEKRYLPAVGFGYLIISTNQGLMTQEDAKKKGIGGRLIAFVY